MKAHGTLPGNTKRAKLNHLFLSTKLLLSKIHFYEDEVQVLKNLLRKNFEFNGGEKSLENTQLLYNEMGKFDRQKISSLNNLFCHQSNIKATAENMMQLSDQYLVREHSQVEEEVKRLQRAFELLKRYFFSISKNGSRTVAVPES